MIQEEEQKEKEDQEREEDTLVDDLREEEATVMDQSKKMELSNDCPPASIDLLLLSQAITFQIHSRAE